MSRWIALTLVVCSLLAVGLGLFQSASQYMLLSKEDSQQNALFGAEPYLAYLSLEGMIVEDSSGDGVFNRPSSSVQVRKLLYKAATDQQVKGVLLRINSPGGTVGLSQEIHDAVIEVKKYKPIVVSFGDVAASGGYYSAAPADRIIANPGTLTASIGVIIHSMNIEKLFKDKLGINPVTIKSGTYKDILSPYRPASDAEKAMIQDLVNTSYRQFLKAVLDGRTANIQDPKAKAERIAQITAIADGRIVIGEDAVKLGLVDELGGLEHAKDVLQTLAKKRFSQVDDKLPLEPYNASNSWIDMLSSTSASAPLSTSWLQVLLPLLSGQSSDLTQAATVVDPAQGRLILNQPLWLME